MSTDTAITGTKVVYSITIKLQRQECFTHFVFDSISKPGSLVQPRRWRFQPPWYNHTELNGTTTGPCAGYGGRGHPGPVGAYRLHTTLMDCRLHGLHCTVAARSSTMFRTPFPEFRRGKR